MRLVNLENEEDIRLARWLARGLSLLFVGFVLLLIALNEDFRESPTLPTVILWILTGCMLVAWRWERSGGRLTLFFSALFFVSLIIQWTRTGQLIDPWWLPVAAGSVWVLFTLLAGWLFLQAGQAAASVQDRDSGEAPGPAHNG